MQKNPNDNSKLPITVKFKEIFWHAEIKSISSNEAFIHSNTFPKLGKSIEINGSHLDKTIGIVKWVSKDGFGVLLK